LVAIILAAIGLVVYYFAYYRTQDPGYLLDSTFYSTKGAGIDTIAYVPMMTPTQITKYLGENFTLSWYLNIDPNTGSGPTVTGGTSLPANYKPLLWIAGIGALVIDMTTGSVYMVVTSYPFDSSNPVPTTSTIQLSSPGSTSNSTTGTTTESTAVSFLSGYNQITLTVAGANVCVYVNGNMKGNCITMPNVSFALPSGVYFLQGFGPVAKITSLQAYPYVMSASNISNNYTATSDSSGNPINVQLPGVTFATLGTSILDMFCKTGLCPSGTTGDVTLGPFTQINYEYS
jgi:hypothetical protein